MQSVSNIDSNAFTALSVVVNQGILNTRLQMQTMERVSSLSEFTGHDINVLCVMLNYIRFTLSRANTTIPSVSLRILFQDEDGCVNMNPISPLVTHAVLQRCRHMLSMMGYSTALSDLSECDCEGHRFYSRVLSFSMVSDVTKKQMYDAAVMDMIFTWTNNDSLWDGWAVHTTIGVVYTSCVTCQPVTNRDKYRERVHIIMAVGTPRIDCGKWRTIPFLYNAIS